MDRRNAVSHSSGTKAAASDSGARHRLKDPDWASPAARGGVPQMVSASQTCCRMLTRVQQMSCLARTYRGVMLAAEAWSSSTGIWARVASMRAGRASMLARSVAVMVGSVSIWVRTVLEGLRRSVSRLLTWSTARGQPQEAGPGALSTAVCGGMQAGAALARPLVLRQRSKVLSLA